MKKYNILLIVRYPVGGIRTFFKYVYTKLDPGKYSFTLIAPEMAEARVMLEDLRDLDLEYIATKQNVTSWELLKTVMRVARSRKFDLMHSHGFTSGICSNPAALFTRTPHIMTSHDVFTAGQFNGLKGFLKRVTLSAMLMAIDCIQCVSNDARDNLLSYLWLLRISKNRIVVIKNGIDTRRLMEGNARDLRKELGLPDNCFLIGFLGRFMSQKGFKFLVDAVALMTERKDLPLRAVVLSFGQDGYIREEQDEVKRRGLSDSVYFLPFVADVASTLKGLDVVAMPSLWEACGLLAMEAMVAGVPLVGTNCIGLREVLDDTPARAVPPRDAQALSAALISEMLNPSVNHATAFAAVAAERFAVEARAAEIENLMLKYLRR